MLKIQVLEERSRFESWNPNNNNQNNLIENYPLFSAYMKIGTDKIGKKYCQKDIIVIVFFWIMIEIRPIFFSIIVIINK